jgi:hypothetical protein
VAASSRKGPIGPGIEGLLSGLAADMRAGALELSREVDREVGRVPGEAGGGGVEVTAGARLRLALGAQRTAFPARASAGTKLAHAPDSPVAFEIEDYDCAAGAGWSVKVISRLSDVPAETLHHAWIARGNEGGCRTTLNRGDTQPLTPHPSRHNLPS